MDSDKISGLFTRQLRSPISLTSAECDTLILSSRDRSHHFHSFGGDNLFFLVVKNKVAAGVTEGNGVHGVDEGGDEEPHPTRLQSSGGRGNTHTNSGGAAGDGGGEVTILRTEELQQKKVQKLLQEEEFQKIELQKLCHEKEFQRKKFQKFFQDQELQKQKFLQEEKLQKKKLQKLLQEQEVEKKKLQQLLEEQELQKKVQMSFKEKEVERKREVIRQTTQKIKSMRHAVLVQETEFPMQPRRKEDLQEENVRLQIKKERKQRDDVCEVPRDMFQILLLFLAFFILTYKDSVAQRNKSRQRHHLENPRVDKKRKSQHTLTTSTSQGFLVDVNGQQYIG